MSARVVRIFFDQPLGVFLRATRAHVEGGGERRMYQATRLCIMDESRLVEVMAIERVIKYLPIGAIVGE